MFRWPCISKYACNENNLMHYLSSVFWVTIPLHLSGLLVTHHQEVTVYICDNWYVLYVSRWVHTCNVTTYRNAVTLQVTDTIRSYDLNFHPVPLGVTVSASLTPWGSQFVTGARGIMDIKKTRGADGGDVSRCTSRPAQPVTVSSLCCDGQIPTAHRTCK
jgi:hypothetical protein